MDVFHCRWVAFAVLLYIVTRDDLSWSCIATAKLLVNYAQHLNLGLIKPSCLRTNFDTVCTCNGVLSVASDVW